MKKRQPTKTPAKKPSCRNHGEQEHQQEQHQLPLDLPNECTSAPGQASDQRCRRNKPASQLSCCVCQRTAGKIRPVGCPPWTDETSQCRRRNKPLPRP